MTNIDCRAVIRANRSGRPVPPRYVGSHSGAVTSKSDGLLPIRNIPLKYLVGLPPDQVSPLRQLCEGHSACFTAPGGTGKSSVVSRYLEIRSTHSGKSHLEVFAVSVDPGTRLREHGRVWRPSQVHILVDEAKSARERGKLLILAVEEQTALSFELLSQTSLFSQVIIVGDSAQGSFDSINGRLKHFLVQSGIQHQSMQLIWRSYNQTQFNMLGCLAYQGKYESYGLGSRPTETLRARLTHTSATMPFTGAVTRVVRHMMVNPGTTVTYVVATRQQAVRMLAGLVFAAQFTGEPERFRIVHHSLLQGAQADVILMDAATFNLTNRDEIEKLQVLVMGRARQRTEVIFDPSWYERDHAIFAAALSGMRFETTSSTADTTAYARFAKLIEQDGRFKLRAALTYLTLEDKDSGKPLLLINMMGDDPIETAFRKQAAEAKKWNVTTELIEMFNTALAEEQSIIEALLPKQNNNNTSSNNS